MTAAVLASSRFASGDPNSMTCHKCRGVPTALCARCMKIVCKLHACGCLRTRFVGVGTPIWKSEAARRAAEWKQVIPGAS